MCLCYGLLWRDPTIININKQIFAMFGTQWWSSMLWHCITVHVVPDLLNEHIACMFKGQVDHHGSLKLMALGLLICVLVSCSWFHLECAAMCHVSLIF
jgi:hypothetical protein